MKTNHTHVAKRVANILEPMKDRDIQLILVGGCSRSGKSTLSQDLAAEIHTRKHSATVLSMDSWIVDVDQRPKNSSVHERYERARIIHDVRNILNGQQVVIPKYDLKSRKRLLEDGELIQVKSGYLILEGVLALSYDELRHMAALSIYIEVDDSLRQKRFESFYRSKGLSCKEVEEVFCEREAEEVPTVKNTRRHADLLCSNDQIIEPS